MACHSVLKVVFCEWLAIYVFYNLLLISYIGVICGLWHTRCNYDREIKPINIMINHYPINSRLFSELDRFVTQAFGQTDRSNDTDSESAIVESAAESEGADEKGWNLRLELPGFKKNEVSLSVDEEFLTVTAETADENRDFLQKVERRVRLSDEVDAENIEARLEDGLLYLEIPRRAKAEPRTISVN